MTWLLISPLLIVGTICHLLTLYVGLANMIQCFRTRSYTRRSGIPFVGPLVFLLAFAAHGPRVFAWVAGMLFGLELLLGFALTLVLRRTKARERPA